MSPLSLAARERKTLRPSCAGTGARAAPAVGMRLIPGGTGTRSGCEQAALAPRGAGADTEASPGKARREPPKSSPTLAKRKDN